MIVLIVGAIICAGAAVWLTVQAGPAPTEGTVPVSCGAKEKRQRAEDFFGGDPDCDVRGGQEMKPRW
jgi:Ti type entry exclusion protein TrbK